jgi:hypothetical protein
VSDMDIDTIPTHVVTQIITSVDMSVLYHVPVLHRSQLYHQSAFSLRIKKIDG